jgi:hypothetical protein
MNYMNISAPKAATSFPLWVSQADDIEAAGNPFDSNIVFPCNHSGHSDLAFVAVW